MLFQLPGLESELYGKAKLVSELLRGSCKAKFAILNEADVVTKFMRLLHILSRNDHYSSLSVLLDSLLNQLFGRLVRVPSRLVQKDNL